MTKRNEGKKTIGEIRRAVKSGTLSQPFRAAVVNKAVGITFAGNFLSKHCDIRPDEAFTWLFDNVLDGIVKLTKIGVIDPQDIVVDLLRGPTCWVSESA